MGLIRHSMVLSISSDYHQLLVSKGTMLGKSSVHEQSAGDGKVMEGLEDDRSSLDTEQGGCTDSLGHVGR
jgi:hypothetical protein